jgi:hypothetical protein
MEIIINASASYLDIITTRMGAIKSHVFLPQLEVGAKLEKAAREL